MTTSSTPSAGDRALVAAAQAGDADAFRQLVEPHRRALLAHCYRMLGSLQDAEDALQDALLRSWRGLRGLRSEERLRPWLFRIATHVCLDLAAKRPRRVVRIDGSTPAAVEGKLLPPPVESSWLEPFPDDRHEPGDTDSEPGARYEARESVELAFVAALQHLPARQRAVLVLRDVFGFSAREVAEFLATTTASVNSALQRARSAVDQRRPALSQQETLRSLGDARVRELVAGYVAAWEANDIEAIRALLVEDAVFAMPPYTEWWEGRDAVTAVMAKAGPIRLRHVLAAANGQPAVAWYVWDDERGAYAPSALEIISFADGGIAQITAFVMPELFPRFVLPGQLGPL